MRIGIIMNKVFFSLCMLILSYDKLCYPIVVTPQLSTALQKLQLLHAQHREQIPESQEFIDKIHEKNALIAKISDAKSAIEKQRLQEQLNAVLDRITVLQRQIQNKNKASLLYEQTKRAKDDIVSALRVK